MAQREILTYPDPILKQVSEPVEEINSEVTALIQDMLATMYEAPGIGLAAPQVSELKRVIVLDLDYRAGEERKPIVLVNPEIVSSEGEILFEEACLSVPEYSAEVKRFAKVKVKGLNEKAEEVEIEGEGLLSVALQHEIDHLDGILFVDRLGLVKRDIFKRKFRKSIKNKVEAI
ncbi:MAG: peptide deformylase [Proteobacteria bacterium]|nr:peptide deformylase [Pseudomonadota bacterium]